jgi:quercetin dioxygenase-like cupin family protein
MTMNDRRDFLTASLMGLAASFIATHEANAAPSSAARLAPSSAARLAPSSKMLVQRPTPAVNLDGWQISASEVSYPPGESSGQHRHPGFVIGYVLEGQYKFAVNSEAPKVLAAGEMFFESFDAPGQVHAVSGNGSATQPCKILAIVFHKKGDPVSIAGA